LCSPPRCFLKRQVLEFVLIYAGPLILRLVIGLDLFRTMRADRAVLGADVVSLAFSSDGKWLAAGGPSAVGSPNEIGYVKVRLWYVSNWRARHELSGTDVGNKVSSVAFQPEGQLLATCSIDEGLWLWRVEDETSLSGRPVHLTGRSHEATSVAFSPDGELLASGTEDAWVRLWQVNGDYLRTLEGHEGTVRSVAFSPDGTTLASASENERQVRLWGLP
jgi:WD40 repeat protein